MYFNFYPSLPKAPIKAGLNFFNIMKMNSEVLSSGKLQCVNE